MLPEFHTTACLVLTAFALFLFTRDGVRLETASLAILIALALLFSLVPYTNGDHHLAPEELFYGFGHEALVAVCALMVVGQGLVRTGALEPVGRLLARGWTWSPLGAALLTLVLGAVLSAFVNNTPIVVLLLPILVSVSLRTGSSPSRILMPMGFATLVGGMATTIGTSTNLLVVSVAAELGQERFGMFDFAGPAVVAGTVAMLYLWLIAPRLLPDRTPPMADGAPRLFEARIELTEESPVAGESLAEARRRADGDLQVVRIRRGDSDLVPLPDVVLRAGDRLHVEESPARLKELEASLGATLYAAGEEERPVDDETPLAAPDQQVAEIVVAPGGALDRRTLSEAQFLQRYGLAVLAVHRYGQTLLARRNELQDVMLNAGDVLLVQGAREQVADLGRDPEFLVLAANLSLPRTQHAPLAIAVLIAVIAAAATGVAPIAVSALTGAGVMVVSGCLSWGAAVRALSPAIIFVVAASLALGKALVETGATAWLADLFLLAFGAAPAGVVLSALMLLMAVLTNVVSNNAAAVIGTPIAIGIAQSLGADPVPFILAVLFGANMSFATPMAYKTNLLVMNAGNYTFGDFLRVGVPLTAIMWVTLSVVLGSMV